LVIFCLVSPPLGEAQWKQSKFVLGTFYDPPFEGNATKDVATLQTAREAYFNLLSGVESFQPMIYRLELADSVNFKSLIYDNRFTGSHLYFPPFNQTVATDVTHDYTNVSLPQRRAIFGYNIGDEPLPPLYIDFNQQKEDIKKWIAHFKTQDPSKLAYINLIPFLPEAYLFPDKEDINGNGQCDAQVNLSYGPDWPNSGQEIDIDDGGCTTVGEQLRVAYYELYLKGLLNGPERNRIADVVSYDFYPFVSGAGGEVSIIEPTYFYNLSINRQEAGTRPFWTYPLSSAGVASFLEPDATQLRFMTFNPIAYGSKGLIYFTYSSVLGSALIDANGVPTPKYYDVQQINHYIRDIVGPVVMNSVHLGAFHKAATPLGQIIRDSDSLHAETPLIADVNNDNILIGLFRDAFHFYAFVVNKSLSSTPTVVLTLKGDWRNRIELAPSVLSYKSGDTYISRPTGYDGTTNTTRVAVPPLAGGEGRLLKLAASQVFTDLVGDKDNFHAGDAADSPRKSPWLIATLGAIAASPGFLPGVDLDVQGSNRPVGLTHVLPTNAMITSAKVRFRLRAEDPLVYNDVILYDESMSQGAGQPFVPFIALRDLLGREPQVGETLELEMDLSNVPIRTRDTSGGPGGHFSPTPDAYRNLLPLLADGEFNLIFVDDVTVDSSELEVTYADARAVVTFEAVKPTSPPATRETTNCPVEFQGKYAFDALLTNTSGRGLSHLRIGINELSNDNLLLAADGERLETSEWFEVPATDGYVDHTLRQGESVTVPFTMCLKTWNPFRLFVDVSGVAE
jgi:hypothetical protein